jgi:hypothetical protein
MLSSSTMAVSPTEGKKSSDRIIGKWAMIPLRNGIANVVEFTTAGKSTVYPFNCSEATTEAPEVSTYSVSKDGKIIQLFSPDSKTELEILSIKPRTMELAMGVGDSRMTFTYAKTEKISPLCLLYKKPKDEPLKKTAFSNLEFVSNPLIRGNPNIDRFIGKWMMEKSEGYEIEIVKNADGTATLKKESDKNWSHLFNAAVWVGDALHFQAYAYSEKEELFDHPYHKAQTKVALTPKSDPNKMIYSMFMDGEKFEITLSRKP